jgi:glutamyl-tRNA reductase
MDLVIYGLNHATAPIEVRERLSFKPGDASGIMVKLRSAGVFVENLLLSTCNRTEFYGVAEKATESVGKLKDILADSRKCPAELLHHHSYRHLNTKAVEHLFRVAAGLDSMVLGEVEILGQIKDAYRTATGVDATGPYLNKLFHHCFRVGKKVRNETSISAGGISIGSITVDLAHRVLGDLTGKRALLIGAGDTGQLVAQHLLHAGIGQLAIANRTDSKAHELAGRLGGSALPFADYPARLAGFDLVITAAGAEGHTIRRDMLKRSRGLYPLMIDLGVPRDVDPDIDKLSGAIVYHIDDLRALTDERLAKRRREIPKVKRILTEETAKFMSWSDSLRAQKTIEDLRARFEGLRQVTLDRWKGRLNPRELKTAERITGDLLGKILHEPIISLKGCELEPGIKKCETCDMFEEGRGCIHGHFNQELKCIITRILFGIQDPSAAAELKKWNSSFSVADEPDMDGGEEID